MKKIHAYFNFNGNCEEAFQFYKEVFQKEFTGLYRFSDMPEDPSNPMDPNEKQKIMHVGLAINEQQYIMGSDCLESMGQVVKQGTNAYIMLDVDSIAEANDLFDRLSRDAQVMEMPIGETFFAERFASFIDKFGIPWMIHYEGNKTM